MITIGIMHWIHVLASCILFLSAGGQGRRPPGHKENVMKKVAIITGASRGIGRTVAKRLARDGFVVVVNYLSNGAEAEQVVAELKGIGGDAIAIQADVSSPADVERLFNETSTKFGGVDVVVHNSGIMPRSPIGKNNFDLFDK